MHKTADENDIIKRDDLNVNKNIFYQQHLYAIKIADIYNLEVRKRLNLNKNTRSVFPTSDMIYTKDIVKDNDPNTRTNEYNYKKNYYDDDYSHNNTKINKKEQNNNNYINKTYNNDDKQNKRKLNTLINNEDKTNNFELSKQSSYNLTDSVSNIATPTSSNIEKIDFDGIIINQFKNENDNNSPLIKNIPEIFCPKEKSRFGFKNSSTKEQDVEIPQFVKTLIFKKVSRHNFTKYVRNIEDLLYSDDALKHEYDNKDPWAHFIMENKYSDQDIEFIDDFEYINKLVLNKCKAHKIIKQ